MIAGLLMARTALQAQQMGIDVAGTNIANVNNENYARRRLNLASLPDMRFRAGIMLGRGVGLESIERVVDIFLDESLRVANSDCTNLSLQSQTLSRMEGIYNELGDSDLSSMMNDFFSAISDMRNYPDDATHRQLVVSVGGNLTSQFQMIDDMITQEQRALNDQYAGAVETVNALIEQIANLNAPITAAERGGMGLGSASALRDQREGLLRELSDMVTIKTYEQANGGIEVHVGGHSLVSGNQFFRLAVNTAIAYDSETDQFITSIDDLDPNIPLEGQIHQLPLNYAVFEADGSRVNSEGGMLQGYLYSRDVILEGQRDAMDTLAGNLIWEFNKIHPEGSGLDHFEDILSTNTVNDADNVLDAAGLVFVPQNGSFNIQVHDVAAGTMQTINIQVDLDGIGADETLNTLVGKINSAMTAAGLSVTATVNTDNTLSIASTSTGTEFSFSDDTSNVLAALGVNTFFNGYNAGNISVNDLIIDNVNLVAAGLSNNSDDGSNAERLIDLRSTVLDGLGGLSIEEYYQSIISDLAIETSITQSRNIGAGAYKESLLRERQSMSGVNLDEETINLIRYQRAYQATARYISTIDEAIEELLNLV